MAKRLVMDDWPLEILSAAAKARPPITVDVIWRVQELDDPEYPELPTYCVHTKLEEGGCDVEFARIIDGEPYVPGPDVSIPEELYNLFSVASHSKNIDELRLEFRNV